MQHLQDILKNKTEMSVEDAIFRDIKIFTPANLKNHLPFWEEEILKDHPHKETILRWLQGVQIEVFKFLYNWVISRCSTRLVLPSFISL